jgi:hypothetical protein
MQIFNIDGWIIVAKPPMILPPSLVHKKNCIYLANRVGPNQTRSNFFLSDKKSREREREREIML